MQVGDGNVVVQLVHAVHVNQLLHDAQRAAQLVGRPQGVCHSGTDHNVGTHFPGNVDGVVVAQTTVDQHLVADAHG